MPLPHILVSIVNLHSLDIGPSRSIKRGITLNYGKKNYRSKLKPRANIVLNALLARNASIHNRDSMIIGAINTRRIRLSEPNNQSALSNVMSVDEDI